MVRRNPPKLPAGKRKTYEIDVAGDRRQPSERCVDVDCGAYANGWRTYVDDATELGQRQAYYIRHRSRRRYREDRDDAGRLVFTFPPGQRCFKDHRPALYVVRGGDHRGNPRGDRRVHTRPEHWAEDLHEHTDRLVEGM